eukprot:4065850-Amphidinium_carterae.1
MVTLWSSLLGSSDLLGTQGTASLYKSPQDKVSGDVRWESCYLLFSASLRSSALLSYLECEGAELHAAVGCLIAAALPSRLR